MEEFKPLSPIKIFGYKAAYYAMYPVLWVVAKLCIGGTVNEFLDGGAGGIPDDLDPEDNPYV